MEECGKCYHRSFCGKSLDVLERAVVLRLEHRKVPAVVHFAPLLSKVSLPRDSLSQKMSADRHNLQGVSVLAVYVRLYVTTLGSVRSGPLRTWMMVSLSSELDRFPVYN